MKCHVYPSGGRHITQQDDRRRCGECCAKLDLEPTHHARKLAVVFHAEYHLQPCRVLQNVDDKLILFVLEAHKAGVGRLGGISGDPFDGGRCRIQGCLNKNSTMGGRIAATSGDRFFFILKEFSETQGCLLISCKSKVEPDVGGLMVSQHTAAASTSPVSRQIFCHHDTLDIRAGAGAGENGFVSWTRGAKLAESSQAIDRAGCPALASLYNRRHNWHVCT